MSHRVKVTEKQEQRMIDGIADFVGQFGIDTVQFGAKGKSQIKVKKEKDGKFKGRFVKKEK